MRRVRMVMAAASVCAAMLWAANGAVVAEEAGSAASASSVSVFSALEQWDDGLSEMCYYDAVEVLYGVERRYTRVHLMNRQWMGERSGVKAAPGDAEAVGVFKFVIAEEIPTDNYNYRFLSTAFLRRSDLKPFKFSVSSQEWCGHTFKTLRWGSDGLTMRSFSYFGDEGDRTWHVDGGCVPYESLLVLARAAVASGEGGEELSILPTLRSNHQVVPQTVAGRLVLEGAPGEVRVEAGTFDALRVTLSWPGAETWFDVEAEAPWRVLGFRNGTARGELRFVERRAYWDRQWGSGTYERGGAP